MKKLTAKGLRQGDYIKLDGSKFFLSVPEFQIIGRFGGTEPMMDMPKRLLFKFFNVYKLTKAEYMMEKLKN